MKLPWNVFKIGADWMDVKKRAIKTMVYGYRIPMMEKEICLMILIQKKYSFGKDAEMAR